MRNLRNREQPDEWGWTPSDYRKIADMSAPLDPRVFKPKYYPIDIQVESKEDGVGAGSVTLDNTAFVMTHITHARLGNIEKSEQDGQYRILLRDDQTTYQEKYMNAVAGFGDCFTGKPIPLPIRTWFRGSITITCDVINDYDRTGEGEPDYYPIQVVLHGWEKWNR